MKIKANIHNSKDQYKVIVSTNENKQSLELPSKPTGFGSNVNGGELLFLALATCYCNDLYREAAKRNIKVNSVEVEVEGTFGGEGEPAADIIYHANVAAEASEEEVKTLIIETDKVAEIQNTLRSGTPVRLSI